MKTVAIIFSLLIASIGYSAAQECGMCEYLVNLVEQYIAQESTESEIESAIEVICKFLPDSYESTCDAVIEAGIPQVIQWVESYENSTVVCGQLGLCSSSKPKPQIVKPQVKVSDSTLCSPCEFLIGAIESWAGSNASVTQIESYLDSLCTLVPTYSQVCAAIVNYEIPTLVQWIEQSESPADVCQQLGLCDSTKKVAAVQIKPIKPTKPVKPVKPLVIIGDSTTCSLCQLVISTVESWVASNSTESQIETSLEVLCSLVPGFTQTCDSIIEAEIPTIVDWLEENESSQQVCQQLGLCDSSKFFVKPIKISN